MLGLLEFVLPQANPAGAELSLAVSPWPPAPAAGQRRLTRLGAGADSHGRMDHPNKQLTANG
jgi:hypothetical protein